MQSGIVMLYIMTNNSISTGLILLAPTVCNQYVFSYLDHLPSGMESSHRNTRAQELTMILHSLR